MRNTSIAFLLICLALTKVNAEQVHVIESDGTNVPAGRPSTPVNLLAIAGKPMEIHWKKPNNKTEKPVLTVDRITDSKRINIATTAIEDKESEWVWIWSPPVTRGPTHYEVQLAGYPDLKVRIETRDPEWVQSTKAKIPLIEWHQSDLKKSEIAELISLGFNMSDANERSENQSAFIRMIPKDSSSGRREITWDENQHDLVVSSPGIAANDIRIRAPRWWISPEALKTDQGLIRILDLYFEIPNNP